MTKIGRIYLYLARRDKSGIKILAILQGTMKTGRVDDIDNLNLPVEIESVIKKCCYDNRMLWEPWIEPADNFSQLKNNLRSRGYSGIPMGGQPIAVYLPGQTFDSSSIQKKQTMIRKN